jgi:hypothetical protein
MDTVFAWINAAGEATFADSAFGSALLIIAEAPSSIPVESRRR